jgi:two-component system, LytTR family, sensor kinase
MSNQVQLGDPGLINTIGHSLGLLLFGFTILLLVRDWRSNGVRQTRLSIVAASLALLWNAGSLVALGSRHEHFIAVVMTFSFSVLSLLPAVLLQVAFKGRQQILVAMGYAVSLLAVGLLIGEFRTPDRGLHQAALIAVAAGFGVLTIAGFLKERSVSFHSPRGKPTLHPASDLLTPACLLLFTTSFLHFGYGHTESPWTVEIAWHHIGIPVALIVLLQDYRFLLLDTFVRFLANAVLAMAYIAGLVVWDRKTHYLETLGVDAFKSGLLLVSLCLSLVLFAYLRNLTQVWLSRAIFRREPFDQTVNRMMAASSLAESEQELLTRAAAEIAHHVGTDMFAVLPDAPVRRSEGPTILRFDSGPIGNSTFRFDAAGRPSNEPVAWAEAQIPLRFSDAETQYLILGARGGGRRYLSEDLEDMRRLGSVVIEQIERFRANELRRLVSQAELRALQAQINPHFLFNAFNTLYGIIDRGSTNARRMVLNLADIFRYFLQGERGFIPLGEELRIIEAYLEIEALRLGDRLTTKLEVPDSAKGVLIPTLSIQPLVENAVKHGIANRPGGGSVRLNVEGTESGLLIAVEDTGSGFPDKTAYGHNGLGVGLENVRRRLTLCFGPETKLHIRTGEGGSLVWFVLPVRNDRPIEERREAIGSASAQRRI